jgi:hypothetical protein
VTRRSTRTAACAAAAIALGASLSAAEHASVTLDYSRAEAAMTCPDEATFRGLVAARLGYDPFVAAGTRALAIVFERRGNEVVGRVNLSGASAQERRERALRGGAGECFELATSMALIVAVAVDPEALQARPESPETSTPAPSPTPPAPPAPTPAEATAVPAQPPSLPPTTPVPDHPARPRTSVRLELAALLPAGIVPEPRGGARAAVAYDRGRWSLAAEGAFLFPSSRDNPEGVGNVSAFVASASLVPCVSPLDAQSWWLDLCAVASVGALRSTAQGVSRAEPATDLFATAGPRAAISVLLSRSVGVGLSAEAPVTLSRVHLYLEERDRRREVWAQASVGFIAAVSVLARFPAIP